VSATAVSFRPKRFESTIDKLTREPGKLSDMADIGGVRAVVDTQDEVDEFHEELARAVDVIRVRDWARAPRSTGYRALHLHVRSETRTIEVQLRTFGQDLWANVVEEESRLSGVNYKAGAGSAAVLEFFCSVADFLAVIELGESHPNLGPRLYEAYQLAQSELVTPALLDLKL
jgi:putative GTP pyrophosphokinase